MKTTPVIRRRQRSRWNLSEGTRRRFRELYTLLQSREPAGVAVQTEFSFGSNRHRLLAGNG